jgi:hypothetical protein
VKIRIVIGLLLLSLMAVLGLELWGNSEQSATQETLFSHNECNNACWQGFEPFVASRDSVEEWLNLSAISYSIGTMGRKNDTLIWEITDKNLLPQVPEKQPAITMEFTQDSILWRIALLDIHVCVDTVISTYGIPETIDADQQNVRLGYPSKGLIFFSIKTI